MARPKTQSVICIHPGCEGKAKCKSLCDKHYVEIHMTKPCSVDGCHNPMRCKGFCDLHYRRVCRTSVTERVYLPRKPTARHKQPSNPIPEDFPRTIYVAFAAGFFDGEGTATVHIGLPTQHKQRSITARVSVVNREKEPLDLFQSLFGGSVREKVHSNGTPKHHSKCFVWQCTGVAAVIALREMLPFLIVKKPQANALIEFEDSRELGGRGRVITEEEEHRRENLISKIRWLNRRGRGSE